MDDMIDILQKAATDGRLVAGVIGVVLVLAGARLYRLAIIAPGFLLGLFLASWGFENLSEYLPRVDKLVRLGAMVGAGAIGALLSWRIEQLAVRLGGSLLVAATTHALLPMIWHHPPKYAAPAAGFIGLLLFPALYRRMLPLLTSAIGAIAVAWAADEPTNVLMIAGLTILGSAVQLASGSKGSQKRE